MALLTNYLAKTRIVRVAPYVEGDVLDLGCGGGNVSKEFASQIQSYTGIERAAHTIDRLCNRFPHHQFYQCDLDSDPIPIDKQYDCILMIALIEHLFNQKLVMERVKSALKPAGRVIITTPTPFGNDIVHRLGAYLGLFAQTAADDHIVIYNRHRLLLLAQEIGFRMIHYERFHCFCNQLAVFEKK